MVETSDSLAERVVRLLASTSERVILGIAGAPGSGKTTLAEWLVRRFDDGTGNVAWVPMDGFHLADSELRRQGIRELKGAINTFDSYGYLATLRRIRLERNNTVYAPEFDRIIEQPIAGGMPVPPSARLIVTEGNYLLDDATPWSSVRNELDEVWFCDVAEAIRTDRLVARHVRFGKSPVQAREWVSRVDGPNSVRVAATRTRADLVVRGDPR